MRFAGRGRFLVCRPILDQNGDIGDATTKLYWQRVHHLRDDLPELLALHAYSLSRLDSGYRLRTWDVTASDSWISLQPLSFPEDFRREPLQVCSMLPGGGGQASLEAGLGQKSFAVPLPFDRDLGQQ